VLAMSTSVSLQLTTISDLVSFARVHPGKLNAAAANGNSDFLLFGFLKAPGSTCSRCPTATSCKHRTTLPEDEISSV